MLLDIEHRLTFQYDAFISESWMELRVEPRTTQHQSLNSFFLAVGPPTKVFRYKDWNGNSVHHFGVPDYHNLIEVVSRSLVETKPQYPGLEFVTDPIPSAEAQGPLRDFTTFGGPVLRSKALERLAKKIKVPASAPVGEQLHEVGRFVHEHLEYRPGSTNFATTTDEVLTHDSGVCQDFAHLTLALLRLRGLPCRYVSGYLHVQRENDAPAESHAWVEAYAPTYGWVAFDPTHNQVPFEHHVVVGFGRHYDDVAPNRGIYRGKATEALTAEVRTSPSDKTGVMNLREEIGQIEVPVYTEVPNRKARAIGLDEIADPQQQQQQQ
ncbi:MAG: transglutaminase family protein [Fimbriimonadaceae bacterium]|nr:transglutaminase family protein [Chthonomonadaceae bacterium]MCO5298087.1 transglutaminase family protein [Fimbriimonadaceae bacterium]